MENIQEGLSVVSALGDLGAIGLLIGAIYLGLSGRVVSRFHYDEMREAYRTQIDYWRRKCGGSAADETPIYGGDDT